MSGSAQVGTPISEHLDQGLHASRMLALAVSAIVQEDPGELGFQVRNLINQLLPLDLLRVASFPDGLLHFRFRHDEAHRRELAYHL